MLPILHLPQACGAKGVPISDTVSRTPPSLSDYTSGAKDASVDSAAAEPEPEPAADTVDSDTAKAIFAAHEPSANADFWSKLARPTDPPTAPDGVTKNDPVLKPVTKVATALKPAAAGGAPLPSIKEFPEEKPAQAASALHSAPCVSADTPFMTPQSIDCVGRRRLDRLGQGVSAGDGARPGGERLAFAPSVVCGP